MTSARFHVDAAFAAMNGHVVGDFGGIVEATTPVDPRYVVVETDMDASELVAVFGESGVPAHLRERDFAERRRHADALSEAFAEVADDIGKSHSRAMQSLKRLGQEPVKNWGPYRIVNGKPKRELLNWREIARHRRHVDEIDGHHQHVRLLHENAARRKAGVMDPTKLVDHEEHPRRASNLDFRRLPDPVNGIISADAATLRAAVVGKEVSP